MKRTHETLALTVEVPACLEITPENGRVMPLLAPVQTARDPGRPFRPGANTILSLDHTMPARAGHKPDLCLAVNCGSSSIKFKVYEASTKRVIVAGSASNVQGDSPAKYKFKYSKQGQNALDEQQSRELDKSTSYQDVFQDILDDVTSPNVLGDGGKQRITVVAHRIVHGGTAKEPVVIKHGDKEEQHTLDQMDRVSAFAPLHVSARRSGSHV